MKWSLAASLALVALVASGAGSAMAGVSISIGDPGFYGRIDVGGYAPPRVVYEQPVIVRQVEIRENPIYLRVPPRHIRHWQRHCSEYGACGRPVYFVDDGWYREVYAPRYRQHHRHYRPHVAPPPPPPERVVERRYHRQPPPPHHHYREREYEHHGPPPRW